MQILLMFGYQLDGKVLNGEKYINQDTESFLQW